MNCIDIKLNFSLKLKEKIPFQFTIGHLEEEFQINVYIWVKKSRKDHLRLHWASKQEFGIDNNELHLFSSTFDQFKDKAI